MTSSGPRPCAVFLDRDGVLNRPVVRDGKLASPRRVEEFELFENVARAVRRLREHGLLVFVVTNQPDVARGYMDIATLERMTALLRSQVPLDGVAVCIHDDADGCECRKPAPGMLLALAQRWNLELACSFMIGDSWRDVEAGRRAGCRTIFIDGSGLATATSDVTVRTLDAAVREIERAVASRNRVDK